MAMRMDVTPCTWRTWQTHGNVQVSWRWWDETYRGMEMETCRMLDHMLALRESTGYKGELEPRK